MAQLSHPVRIGVVGAGTITQSVHLASLRRAGFDVRLVCDISPSRARAVAASVGAAPSIDPAEVFASDVDAVLLATPGSHAALAADAIRAGKHVLAEKPLALTLREVDELAALASDAGVVTQVGYMKMFDPLTDTAAREIGRLHDTRLIRVTVMHPADGPQVAHLRLGPPADDADPGTIAAARDFDRARAAEALTGASDELIAYYQGVLSASVVHELSLLRALGIAAPETWEAELITPLGGDEPPSLLARARVGDAAYVLSWNWLPEYPEYDEELCVLAANGRLEYHLAKPYLLEDRGRLVSRRHSGVEREDTTYTSGHDTGFLRQLDAFARAIDTGRPTVAEFSTARSEIRQLQQIAQAIGDGLGQRVRIEEG